jgi:hypothetical protein
MLIHRPSGLLEQEKLMSFIILVINGSFTTTSVAMMNGPEFARLTILRSPTAADAYYVDPER